MVDEDRQEREAARLYAENATFQAIADQLDVSKSHAQVLVRRYLKNTPAEDYLQEPQEPANENPIQVPISEAPMVPHQPEFISAPPMVMPEQLLGYADQEYELELTAIPKKITLTAYHIGIFDVFVNGGYTGTLSEFAQDAFVFMFTRTTPQGRAN